MAERNIGIRKLLKAEETATKIAKRLSTAERPCSRQNVEYWIERGYVPANWCQVVSTKFDIPLHELNSKVYPRPTSVAA